MEQVFDQKIVLVCEECSKKSDARTRDEHVDHGWNWVELEINDQGEVWIAHCPNCFDEEKLAEEVEKYRKTRTRENQELSDFQ